MEPTLESTPSDLDLVRAATQGDSRSLHQLLSKFQAQVYPLALRMLWNSDDARDATQEILLKVTTHLASFEGRSAPSTWVYRIATNHLLNCQRSRAEVGIRSFEEFGRCLAQMPDAEPSPEPSPEDAAIVEETRVGCLVAMLVCLDRQQRIVFLLGEVLQLSDTEAVEVLDMSAAQFRQILSRARKQLYAFLGGHCGLADPANACRCARKTKAFIAAGIVDPRRRQFVPEHLAQVSARASACNVALKRFLDEGHAHLYREMPEAPTPRVVETLEALLACAGGDGARGAGGMAVGTASGR